MGPSRDPFRVFDDPAAQDDGLVEEEGSDDEPGPWSAGSSGGWSEACGYRWITMQVRMRGDAVNDLDGETTSGPGGPDLAPEPWR
jgi:hypothetical protein